MAPKTPPTDETRTKPPVTTEDPRTPETGTNASAEKPAADTDAALVVETRDGRTVPLEAPGPGVGAERLATVEVAVKTTPVEPAPTRAPVVEPPLAAVELVVDPSAVPGTRDLPAVTQVMFNGKLHEAGDTLRGVDFRTYSELVTIGAVVAIDWFRQPLQEGESRT